MVPKVSPIGRTCLSSLAFANLVRAAIGPVGDLRITNEDLAPDGFNRTVVVAGGSLPGPLIKGNKVSHVGLSSASVELAYMLSRGTGSRSMFSTSSPTRRFTSRRLL